MNPVNSVKNRRIVRALLNWFSRNARDLPWRQTRDPYAIWISEIMLQQTQVKTVLPYWERWMKNLPAVKSLARAKPETVLKLWEGLGYYTRARNLQKAAKTIEENHGGIFPENFDEVLALPGIGPYTAGAICSIAFDQPTPILDGNVMRVLTRIYGIEGDPREPKTNRTLWNLSEALVKIAARRQETLMASCSALNQSLMELGALVCTPRQPKCPECPVQKHCVALREGKVQLLPEIAERAPATKRHFVAFVVERKGRFLVRQRPEAIVNALLWEFPNLERNDSTSFSENEFFRIAKDALPICSIKHSITRYRMTLDAFRATLRPRKKFGPGKWLSIPELRELPFASAHRQILDHLARRIPPPRLQSSN